MAQANQFYKGEEKKFAINIEAAGFDMDTDDFKLEVSTNAAGDSVSVLKAGEPTEEGVWTNEEGSLVVFYETETVATPAEEEGGEPVVTTTKTWWAIVDTQFFTRVGDLKVIATAFVKDPKAYDGVRNAIDVKTLGSLKNV